MTAGQVRAMMIRVSAEIIEARESLCEADRPIGDGDHGIGMSIGFEAAREALEARDFEDVYDVFSTVGRTLIKTMGGASGILFGLLFLAGSKNKPAKPEVTAPELAEFFERALLEIQTKGQAKVGDKTLVDALDPMVKALRSGADQGHPIRQVVEDASLAAEKGKETSRNHVARFGKAKTLGERALGFPDPGAVSIALIAGAMAGWARDQL